MSGRRNQDKDAELFRRSMAEIGVTRSPARPYRHPEKTASVRDRRRAATNGSTPRNVQVPTRPAIDQTGLDAPVLFARAGVPSARIKQLRRGRIPLEESLDLHGMRSGAAEAALERYLEECLELGLRCVLLIHGKGRGSEVSGGVLKPLALHWLRLQPEVLAFCEALPGDGGSGALYLLLDADKPAGKSPPGQP